MSGGASALAVRDAPQESRYEVRLDGELAALAAYQRTPELVVFTHTEVLPGHEGQGLASQLVREALDDVRRRHLQVVPVCPFVRAFIGRHPDYADLVHRSRTRAGAGD